MKKTLSFLLMIVLILSFTALGKASTVVENPSQGVAFDKTIFETSDLYRYDKFEKEWKIYSTWEKKYSNMIVELVCYLSDTYVTEGWGPDFRVTMFNRDTENYDKVEEFYALVDDKLYSFVKFKESANGGYSYILGGNVFRSFMNSLKSAEEIAFKISAQDKFGGGYSITIDPNEIKKLPLTDIIEMNELVEKSNAWTSVSVDQMAFNDTSYGASMD